LQRLGVRKKGVDIGRLLKVGRTGRVFAPKLSEDVVQWLLGLRAAVAAGGVDPKWVPP
jgi:hypothetical protein